MRLAAFYQRPSRKVLLNHCIQYTQSRCLFCVLCKTNHFKHEVSVVKIVFVDGVFVFFVVVVVVLCVCVIFIFLWGVVVVCVCVFLVGGGLFCFSNLPPFKLHCHTILCLVVLSKKKGFTIVVFIC